MKLVTMWREHRSTHFTRESVSLQKNAKLICFHSLAVFLLSLISITHHSTLCLKAVPHHQAAPPPRSFNFLCVFSLVLYWLLCTSWSTLSPLLDQGLLCVCCSLAVWHVEMASASSHQLFCVSVQDTPCFPPTDWLQPHVPAAGYKPLLPTKDVFKMFQAFVSLNKQPSGEIHPDT